jgi:hypothetical protein
MSTDKAPRARDENPHRPQTARLDNALLEGAARIGTIGARVDSGRFWALVGRPAEIGDIYSSEPAVGQEVR